LGGAGEDFYFDGVLIVGLVWGDGLVGRFI
jgi:hypothetical protein